MGVVGNASGSHEGARITDLAFSWDSQRLALATSVGSVVVVGRRAEHMWSVELELGGPLTGALVTLPPPTEPEPNLLAWSPNSRYLLSVSVIVIVVGYCWLLFELSDQVI